MFLVDTNIISEMRKIEQGKGNIGVTDWVANTPSHQICTSAVVMMELERGVLSMERKDVEQGKRLRNWIENVVKNRFSDKILAIDATTAGICARLHIPDRSPENDAWIAAQAIQHGLTVVTRNEKDFAELGVQVWNPFADG